MKTIRLELKLERGAGNCIFRTWVYVLIVTDIKIRHVLIIFILLVVFYNSLCPTKYSIT